HASRDLLWFLGGAGCLIALAGRDRWHRRTALVAAGWFAAAILSIALNGARDLPQYFVQAGPALAFLTATGTAAALAGGRLLKTLAIAVAVLGVWRVGTQPPVGGLRWGGLPEAYENIRFDLQYMRGRIDRHAYLARFTGAQKYDAAESDALAALVRETTTPDETIFVFGFAPAVYLEAERLSASRFFWSRPVVLEFAADEPGYGSRGLLADLQAAEPAIIALQKQDWGGPRELDSEAFARQTPHLREWLDAHYALERDTPFFAVLRRRPVT
ncbi:MAG: hypothetical protein IT181_14125, partial [Acidobacteria bacterium]|nr:hypothetical protein [Acidobacteriota bacterium]